MLWQRYTESAQTVTNQIIENTTAKGSKGRFQRQKDFPPADARPDLLQVTENGLSDSMRDNT